MLAPGLFDRLKTRYKHLDYEDLLKTILHEDRQLSIGTLEGAWGPIKASEVCHATTWFRVRYGFGLTVGDIEDLRKNFYKKKDELWVRIMQKD